MNPQAAVCLTPWRPSNRANYDVPCGYTGELRGVSFDRAIERAADALKNEGLGMLGRGDDRRSQGGSAYADADHRRTAHKREASISLRRNLMTPKDLPIPKSGFVLTHFLTVADVKRSARFYADILGGAIVLEGEPTMIRIANSWMILNVGGGPTDDKPNVVLRPPKSSTEVSSFLNIRVADIQSVYREWKARGAEFLTEPKDHKHEFRCYMKDPDGYLIEVGQTKTGAFAMKEPA
jgi:predicted enzyme related to lactoylglutathione lyase